MKSHRKTIALLIAILLLSSLPACGTPEPTVTPVPTPTPEPPGRVTGTLVYEHLTDRDNTEPAAEALIALCRVADAGLPEGPPIATKNRGETEPICTLQGEPTTLTDADGAFSLDGVPPGTYLVLFHLFPSELGETEWDGVEVTEALVDEIEMSVAPSEEAGFWQAGGPAIALANWKAGEGMTLTQGNACSDRYGFCLSLRDAELDPVIEVDPQETVEVELRAHFQPEK